MRMHMAGPRARTADQNRRHGNCASTQKRGLEIQRHMLDVLMDVSGKQALVDVAVLKNTPDQHAMPYRRGNVEEARETQQLPSARLVDELQQLSLDSMQQLSSDSNRSRLADELRTARPLGMIIRRGRLDAISDERRRLVNTFLSSRTQSAEASGYLEPEESYEKAQAQPLVRGSWVKDESPEPEDVQIVHRHTHAHVHHHYFPDQEAFPGQKPEKLHVAADTLEGPLMEEFHGREEHRHMHHHEHRGELEVPARARQLLDQRSPKAPVKHWSGRGQQAETRLPRLRRC